MFATPKLQCKLTFRSNVIIPDNGLQPMVYNQAHEGVKAAPCLPACISSLGAACLWRCWHASAPLPVGPTVQLFAGACDRAAAQGRQDTGEERGSRGVARIATEKKCGGGESGLWRGNGQKEATSSQNVECLYPAKPCRGNAPRAGRLEHARPGGSGTGQPGIAFAWPPNQKRSP